MVPGEQVTQSRGEFSNRPCLINKNWFFCQVILSQHVSTTWLQVEPYSDLGYLRIFKEGSCDIAGQPSERHQINP